MRDLFVLVLVALTAGPAAGGVAINEIVVRPGSGEGEWIELTETDSASISLDGWVLRDATGRDRRIDAGLLSPRGYLILAARPDSLRDRYGLSDAVTILEPDGWPILNDRDAGTGLPADLVVLLDAQGTVQDSIAYFEDWLPAEPGRSLERVDVRLSAFVPGAWGWSVAPEGATPGRANSLLALGEAGTDVWSGPAEASPRVRPAVFVYRLPRAGTLDIRLLDTEGREVAILQEHGNSPAVGSWTWGPGSALPEHSGLYFLCLRWQGGKDRLRRCRAVWVNP